MINPSKTPWLKKIALLLILTFSCSLIGCWDHDEIDEIGYVLFLGLDQGQENKLTVTALIAAPHRINEGPSGGTNGNNPSEHEHAANVVSVEAPTFIGALNMMTSFVDRRLSLKHTKVVIFSEEIARGGIMPYLAVMARFREFRRSIFLTVTRTTSAKEYLEQLRPLLEANPVKNAEIAVGTAGVLGSIPSEPYFHFFYNNAKSRDSDPICLLANLQRPAAQGEGTMVRPDGWVGAGAYFPGELPRSGGDTREFIGGAVFRDDRFVGEINGDGMTALKIIRGTIETFTLSIEDPIIPDKMLSISLRFPKTPRKRVDLSDEIPRLHITVYPEGNLVGVQSSGVNYEEPYNTEILEEAINRQLNTFMETLIGQAQHEFQADILNFGKTVKRYFRTQGEWEAYDWLNSRFPHAKITVETHTKLRGFGLLRKNAPLSRENSE